MARRNFGLFGALFAVGSVLAWKWAHAQHDAQRRGRRDISRWEDEGGKIVTPATASTSAQVTPIRPASATGDGAVGGTADAWNFPRS
jgi:hypothetical protein